ncbi:hypothetical protein N7G274_000572 [Stereocaulon virgatum]|uniref:Uncharacterized protein n=1 Tax=Stereocaulon virgatum TaxID=373712 RepID=A0ABR4ATS5_9LECA
MTPVPQLLLRIIVINTGCNNLKKVLGYEICVVAPGPQYNPPMTSSPVSPDSMTSALVPTTIANGTNKHCGRYYDAAAGDHCNLVCLRYGISLVDFIILSPEINSKSVVAWQFLSSKPRRISYG